MIYAAAEISCTSTLTSYFRRERKPLHSFQIIVDLFMSGIHRILFMNLDYLPFSLIISW